MLTKSLKCIRGLKCEVQKKLQKHSQFAPVKVGCMAPDTKHLVKLNLTHSTQTTGSLQKNLLLLQSQIRKVHPITVFPFNWPLFQKKTFTPA